MLTFGIEEEYLLLDADTGVPVPAADAVAQAAQLRPGLARDEVQRELLQAQLEVATPICESLDEAGGHLLRLRHELASAAESERCMLVAVGAAPLRGPTPPAVTARPRYHAIYEQAPRLVDEQLINGMHVHVAVPTRELGVLVVNRLQRWLPVLLAMASNSPVWDGGDTGFASWRTVHFDRWPVAGPAPRFKDVVEYDERVEALIRSGIVRDRAQLYWHARVSEIYPTVEIRTCDVQLRVDDAVMAAGLVRALVATALQEELGGQPDPGQTPELARAASWRAARHGLSGDLLDPADGTPCRAVDVVMRMLDHVRPQLITAGDLSQVTALVARLLRDGTGADRQRRVLDRDGVGGLLAMLAAETVACGGPALR